MIERRIHNTESVRVYSWALLPGSGCFFHLLPSLSWREWNKNLLETLRASTCTSYFGTDHSLAFVLHMNHLYESFLFWLGLRNYAMDVDEI